jgi:hypothetical protein
MFDNDNINSNGNKKYKLKDTDDILNALDGCDINIDNYNNLTNLNTKIIAKIMANVLNRFEFSQNEFINIKHKLKDYMYVDEIDNITPGSYIRWINIHSNENEPIVLTKGSFICDIKILQNGIYIICKNIFGKIFQLKWDNYIIFKKISDNEKIILYALDYIDK